MLREANSVIYGQRRAHRRRQPVDTAWPDADSGADRVDRRRQSSAPTGRTSRSVASSSGSTTSRTATISRRTTRCRTTRSATTPLRGASAGWRAAPRTSARRSGVSVPSHGAPNGFSMFKIADDSTQTTDLTFASVSADSQISERWRSTIRFGYMNRDYQNINPTPTGIPSGGNYLGQIVTLEGANGYSVTGQGILDFCCTFPSVFDSGTTRRTLLRPDKFPGLPGARALGRRAHRARGWLHAEHLQIGQRAHQWRRICRSAGERQSRVCQRRVWRRSQRGLRHGRDTSRLCRRVSSQPLVYGDIWRYEADVQRRHRNQGAHHFAGAVVSVQCPATAP